jgi:UDP-N-acetyl-D-glucosamine dehydrogenase
MVRILEEESGLTSGVDFYLGYSPERIDPGNPTWNVVNTPKVVSGINEASLREVKAFYDTVVDTTVPVSGTREAELTKLMENTFRHVNIALVNELTVFGSALGIDVWEAIDAASTKPFGFMRFTPGPGVGGHCLPIDPSYLSWRVKLALGKSFRFVELANDINDHMPDYVVQRLATALNNDRKAVNGSKVLLLGLSYKKNTGDARESPAIRIAELLLGLGAEVSAADPHVLPEQVDDRIRLTEVTAEEVGEADAVVLLTDHDAFDVLAIAANARYVLDTRNRVPRGAGHVEYL